METISNTFNSYPWLLSVLVIFISIPLGTILILILVNLKMQKEVLLKGKSLKVFRSSFLPRPLLTLSPDGIVLNGWFKIQKFSWPEIKQAKMVLQRVNRGIMCYFILKTEKEIIRFMKTDFSFGEVIENEIKKHVHLTKTYAKYNWMQLVVGIPVLFIFIVWMKTGHVIMGILVIALFFYFFDFLFKRKWLS